MCYNVSIKNQKEIISMIKSKFVRIVSYDDIVIGQIYEDDSRNELIELYTDHNNKFCINFLTGSDIAYKFLPECTELLEILKDGIVGLSIKSVGEMLIEKGYVDIRNLT